MSLCNSKQNSEVKYNSCFSPINSTQNVCKARAGVWKRGVCIYTFKRIHPIQLFIITELLQKWVEILNDCEILKLHHVTYLYTPRNGTWCTAQPKFQRKGVLLPFFKTLLLNCYDCLPTRSKEWLILFFLFYFFQVKQQNPYIPNISVTWEEMCNYTIWHTASPTGKTWRTLLGYSNLKLASAIGTHHLSSFSTRMIKLLVQNYGNSDPKMSLFSHADNILLEEQDVSLCYVLTSR